MTAFKDSESNPGEFHIVPTADGSLTARFDDHETMHSLRGAFNETAYIYGTAFSRIAEKSPPRVLSLGLGLGYVEILTTALFLQIGLQPRGISFELVKSLRESFLAWLKGGSEVLVPHSLYDDVATRARELTGVEEVRIKKALAAAVDSGDWIIATALTPNTTFTHKYNCVAFDAFSSKSTPELWSREFLDPFLRNACDETCVLSTYACTGHLKRALVDGGFKLEIREGYASKRDSTLATRETPIK